MYRYIIGFGVVRNYLLSIGVSTVTTFHLCFIDLKTKKNANYVTMSLIVSNVSTEAFTKYTGIKVLTSKHVSNMFG